MKLLRSLQRKLFDIRPGEHRRTWSMFFYLLFVLFAYYIVKPVSRAMFLNKFDVDRLPSLYILIAAFGGVLAYFYSKLAARSSLRVAVLCTTAVSIASLLGMWSLIHHSWMVYVLNVWVSLFSIALVSQGWLVAGNLFNAREAKRLYPLLGMGMVLGAAFGGEFTNRTAELVGTRNLLPACAVMVGLAYICFRFAVSSDGGSTSKACAADEVQTDFSIGEIGNSIRRIRHLQVIMAIMVAMYVVDTLVEYQFQAMAKAEYSGDELTAFFGHFYGLYLNITEFVFQLVVTGFVVRRFGVGGTLQIAPVTILLASMGTVVSTRLHTAAAVRLAEASTRYTLNRTGMELLYMPLPQELRNRVKAFIDIFVDRFSRGLGGMILLLLTATSADLGVRGVAGVTMLLCIPWMWFSYLARKEYISTVRKRFEYRKLDIEASRVSVQDAGTIRLLENTAVGGNARQASYALALLGEVPRYNIRPLLEKLAGNDAAEVRERVFQIGAATGFNGLLPAAMEEVRQAKGAPGAAFARSAVGYALKFGAEPQRLATEWLEDENPAVAASTLEALRENRDLAEDLIGREWLDRTAKSSDPRRRELAAAAIGVRGDQGTEVLHRLLDDQHPAVAGAAATAAGRLKNRAYLHALISGLGNPKVRRDAIEALAQFGPVICGTLNDVLLDENVPRRIRRQIPRVLKDIPNQRSVDALVGMLAHPDLVLRGAVIKALNRLRENAPQLNFNQVFVSDQILSEARYYYELSAALAPFRQRDEAGRSASRLLARTMEERLSHTLERLFRLLGLRYPPKEMHSAYLAVSRKNHEDAAAALEFLDNTLERDLKRILLPLFDAPEHSLELGQEFFGVEPRTVEEAIRELIRSQDPWLVACAVSAAAELKLKSLAPDVAQAAAEARGEVSEVARSAEAQLLAA